MTLVSFGQRLLAIRNRAGYGKDQVGFASLYGIGKTRWSAYENDKGYPSTSSLIQICQDWNINPKWLIKGVGEMLDSKETMGSIKELIEELPTSEILEIQQLLTDLLSSRLIDNQQED